MARDDRRDFLAKFARSLQSNADRAGPAAGASYTLIGAVLVLGGIGYALDKWLGASPWFLITGLMVGIIVGMWELAKTAFRR
jgi:F0F1-type ATP synthase assembly protein I